MQKIYRKGQNERIDIHLGWFKDVFKVWGINFIPADPAQEDSASFTQSRSHLVVIEHVVADAKNISRVAVMLQSAYQASN